MEENVVKFQEKLKNLVALAKKKKNILEIQEINDVFRDMELEPTQMDKVFEYLEANGIDVLQMNDDSNVDPVHIQKFQSMLHSLLYVMGYCEIPGDSEQQTHGFPYC